MAIDTLVQAAQYLRVSTDHQQYSLQNQADRIGHYAAEHGFQIVKTYSDAAKSGLRLKNRIGLQQLLKDVVAGATSFRSILVYDVSRWGRFQDADEAAHYEFLCKSSGVPVLYCAETFTNDDTMPSSIMKALKRTMAGEYSRELSVKVKAGLVRLASMGFKLGGGTPYGLRRLLLDCKGNPKQVLAPGERKSLASERVTLIPGPAEEILIVKRIFHDFVSEHKNLTSIAAQLNRDSVKFPSGAKWNAGTVTRILKQQNYIGVQVWGRTTAFLSGPVKRLPPEQWITRAGAFEPIIARELFDRAQEEFKNFTCALTNEDLLERLRIVLHSKGKLTGEIIQQSRLCPGGTTYHKRLGGLLRAYAQLGYSTPELCSIATSRQCILLIRRKLFDSFLEQFPDDLEEVRRCRSLRARLRYKRTGLLISVVIARCCPTDKGKIRWLLEPHRLERDRVAVVALLDEKNTTVKRLSIHPNLRIPMKSLRFGEGMGFLEAGLPLEQPSDLMRVIRQLRGSRIEV